ncbi:hypothetical protein [Luteolibacter soli]|uniref:Uncharacterized protein n=1 Tax=Luteolibacter soli TaxID=3135280 RepID=A0ABU9AVH9_9BACT
MHIFPILSDEDFLAANSATIADLQSRHPRSTTADLISALRTAQWLMDPGEMPQLANLASQLLSVVVERGLESDPTIPVR